MNNLQHKHYFEGFNILRALAAFSVLLCHVQLFQERLYIQVQEGIFPDGHKSVVMFFVLSGFLITFLLKKEFEFTKSINFKLFFEKRIRRIVPVYIIVFVLSILLSGFWNMKCAFWVLSFLPNFGRAIHQDWIPSPHLWSIGVEMQYYLVWPCLVYWLSSRNLKWILAVFILFFMLGSVLITHWQIDIYLSKFLYLSRYDALALGSLSGLLFFENHEKISKVLERKWLSISLIIIPLVLWLLPIDLHSVNDPFYAIVFTVLILTVATKGIYVKSKVLNYLGQISYGIYMYHWIVLLLVFDVFKLIYKIDNILLVYIVVIVGTVALATISWFMIEKRLIKNLKNER